MDTRWANFCIEKVNQKTSSTNGKGQWEVVGKYDWTKLFAVKLWTNPKGSGYPNKDICPEHLDFAELNRRTVKDEKLEEDILVKVARGNLVPKYQREYDDLADEDDSVKVSEDQSEFMQNVRDFMFHWYLVEPYWKAADGSDEEIISNESSNKPDTATNNSGEPKYWKLFQEVRFLLDKLELEFDNTEVPETEEVTKEIVSKEDAVEETQTALSEDDEIDRLLNEDPMSSGGE